MKQNNLSPLAYFVLSFAAVTFIFGCSGKNKKPQADMNLPKNPWIEELTPDEQRDLSDLLKITTDNKKDANAMMDFYHKFYLAKKGTDSCKNYSELASEKTFLLAPVALARALEQCETLSPKLLSQLEDLKKSPPQWLKSFLVDLSLRTYKRQKDTPRLLEAISAKAALSNRPREKVSLLQEGVALAQLENNTLKMKELSKKLYTLAPRLNPNPQESDLIKVANDFRSAREFNRALQTYRSILRKQGNSVEERFQALQGIKQTHKLAQNKEEYLNATMNTARYAKKIYLANKTPANLQRYYETYVNWARAVWTEGMINDTHTVLNSLETNIGRIYPMGEIYWLKGRLFEEKRDFTNAAEMFRKSVSVAKNYPGQYERSMWYLAWNLRKLKNYHEASTLLMELKSTTKDPFEMHKYSFWLGKTLKDAGLKQASETEYKDLTEKDALGYYGLAAYRELGQKLPALASHHVELESAALNPPTNVFSQDELETVHWLMAVRESDFLENYLNNLTQTKKIAKDFKEENWIWILKAYARSGKYLPLFSIIGTLPSDARAALLAKYPELLFPRPHLGLVVDAGQRLGVKPELIYAIMRQESAFNPEARSHMDAFGLMQVIPEVAERHRELAKVSFKNPEELFAPEVNIPVGAAVLKSLFGKYKGQFVLAVASYNASEKAIATWVNTRLGEDPLEFIEDIPYQETKGYIKLVLRNMIFYSRVLSPSEDIAFPEWCLNNIQDFKS